MTLRTGHTGLNVTDLDRSLAFYRDVLGFALLAEGKEDGRRYAFLGDERRVRPALAQEGVPAPVLLALGEQREAEDVPVEGERAVEVGDVQAGVAGAQGHGSPLWII